MLTLLPAYGLALDAPAATRVAAAFVEFARAI
jgi:hypothetical protein